MKVSVEVYKIICAIYSTIFLNSGGSVDDVLVKLSIVFQIIEDANLMWISFSVKHSQTFWESWMSLSNMYSYPFTQSTIGDENKLKVMIRNQKTKELYMWTIMGIFQSWVDYLSTEVQAFI